MAAVPNRGFLKVGNFNCRTCSGGTMRNHAKFRPIGQSVADISRFLDFSGWRPPPFWILKLKIFNDRNGQWVELRHHAKFRGHRSKRCRDIATFIFFHIFDFKNFKIFNDRNGQEGQTASLCQISPKSLVPWPRYGDFRFF